MRGLVITARQIQWPMSGQTLLDLFDSGRTTCEAVGTSQDYFWTCCSKEKMPSSGQEDFLSGGILSTLEGPYNGHCSLN